MTPGGTVGEFPRTALLPQHPARFSARWCNISVLRGPSPLFGDSTEIASLPRAGWPSAYMSAPESSWRRLFLNRCSAPRSDEEVPQPRCPCPPVRRTPRNPSSTRVRVGEGLKLHPQSSGLPRARASSFPCVWSSAWPTARAEKCRPLSPCGKLACDGRSTARARPARGASQPPPTAFATRSGSSPRPCA